MKIILVLMCSCILWVPANAQRTKVLTSKATYLSDLTWQQAEKVLTRDTIVVIPLGGQSKAHGPHLPLSADFVQAEYYKRRVAERLDVVIAPTVNYAFYPPFIEFPGSTTIGLSNAKGMIGDICRGLSRFGVRRFYVINQGVSTNAALQPAVAELRDEGILLRFTNTAGVYDVIKDNVKQQKGTHADEVETSIMLYVAPELVDMKKADRDFGEQRGTGIWPTRSRDPKNPLYSIYNPSGTYGDATLATKAKGKIFVDAMLSMIFNDIENLRVSELPTVRSTSERLERFVGSYQIGPNDSVTVTLEGDSLRAQKTGRPKMVLLPAGASRFEIGRTEYLFLSNGTGQVTHLVYFSDGNAVSAPRKID